MKISVPNNHVISFTINQGIFTLILAEGAALTLGDAGAPHKPASSTAPAPIPTLADHRTILHPPEALDAAATQQLTLGEHLRKWREHNGFTQGQVAGALGYSQPFISAIESGKTKPSDHIASKIFALMK
jgi:DNA-binding XRE family transcriptional regulator